MEIVVVWSVWCPKYETYYDHQYNDHFSRTDQVQDMINSTNTITATNYFLTDTSPNIEKILHVKLLYSDGTTEEHKINEGDTKTIADKVSANSSPVTNISQGERGSTGAQGPQGTQGPQGPTGSSSLSHKDTYLKVKNAVGTVHMYHNGRTQAWTGTAFLMKFYNKIYGITVAHNVVAGNRNTFAEEIYMTISNHSGHNTTKLCKCKVVGVCAYADIAVFEFETNEPNVNSHTTVSFATYEASIGDACLLIGNPMGLDETSLSMGVIRDAQYHYSNNIESVAHDAITYAGNSGSALYNPEGDVIAILSAGIGDFEGFAWGASKRVVKETVERIIQTKDNYVCGTLKVPLTYMTTPAALQLDIDILDGMLVMGSYGNLQGGDVILEFDGLPIGHDKESITMSVFFKKGQTLRAKILRNKQEMTINVKVEELSLLEDVPLGTYNHKIKRHVIV